MSLQLAGLLGAGKKNLLQDKQHQGRKTQGFVPETVHPVHKNHQPGIERDKKKPASNIKAMGFIMALEQHTEVMKLVYDMAYAKEVKGEKSPNEGKIFSIYERHTDIIVKGSRDAQFGHKVDLASGRSKLILYCELLRGNPSDSKLFAPALDSIAENYGAVPRDYATDGSYASMENRSHAEGKGVVNIVFNKIVGSLQNVASSKNMETRLKKWQSCAEAVISNLKLGFNMARCTWKGWGHFVA